MDTDWEDGFELEDEVEEQGDETTEDEADGLAVESDDEADEEAEAAARVEALAVADAVLREFHGEADEPRYDDSPEGLRVWSEYLEGILSERRAEQEQIEAVFAAEEGAAGQEFDEPEPIDFSTWDALAFDDLVKRVTGTVPKGAPRSAVGDDEWGRAMALVEG